MEILLEKLLLVFISTGVIATYIIMGIAILMFVQLISYRIFRINPYKRLLKRFEV